MRDEACIKRMLVSPRPFTFVLPVLLSLLGEGSSLSERSPGQHLSRHVPLQPTDGLRTAVAREHASDASCQPGDK